MTSSPSRFIIKSNSEFRQRFHDLKKGDVVSCILNLTAGEEYILLDLMERGVRVFPPAISQLASRSKCCQAVLFMKWMHPQTFVVRKRADLVQAIDRFSQAGVQEVVTKLDKADCGLGISLWKSAEDVFNQIAFSRDPPYPFVIQPFLADSTDLRVVWIGSEYKEAYWRKNPWGFRNNLHFGGLAGQYDLAPEEEALCMAVMKRGNFPYAHIDILKAGNGEVYLSEISLFGGLKGAQISGPEAMQRKKAVEEDFLKGL